MTSRTLLAGGAALSGRDLLAVRLQGMEGVDGFFEYHLTLKTPDSANVPKVCRKA